MTFVPVGSNETVDQFRIKFNDALQDIDDQLTAITGDYIAKSQLDTNTSLALNSDSKVATQKAAKAYITTKLDLTAIDTDTSLTANSDLKVPSQKAAKAFADNTFELNDALLFKGTINASTNPNYPAANSGWLYVISAAGKIGGASGVNVEIGDLIQCILDSTASGNHATVGSRWNILQNNLVNSVTGPASATNNNFAQMNGGTGKIIKNSTYNSSSFQPSHVNLTELAGESFIADKAFYADNTNSLAPTDNTSLARSLLAASTTTAMKTVIKVPGLSMPLINYGGMNFNGSTDYLDGNSINGIVDSKKGLIAICLRFANAAGTNEDFFHSTGDAIQVRRQTTGTIRISAENVGGSTVLNIQSAAGACSAAGTYYILASWDLAVPGSGRVYVNDVSSFQQTTFTNDFIDYTVTEYSIGAGVTGGSRFTGDIYSVYFDSNNYLDFDIESNRRKFHDSASIPLYLGKNGELPLDGKPLIFLGYDSAAKWYSNKGSSTSFYYVTGNTTNVTVPKLGQYTPALTEIDYDYEKIQQSIELSNTKQAPIDFVSGFADHLYTSTRIDLAASTLSFVTGHVRNLLPSHALIPKMTSNSAPSGTVVPDSEYTGSYMGWNAMDRNNATHWSPTSPRQYGTLEYQFPAAKTVRWYAVGCDNNGNANAPSAWTFEYHNGSTWVTLHTATAQTGWTTNQVRYFSVSAPISATRYRLNITTTATAAHLAVSVFQVFDDAITPLSPQTSNSLPSGQTTSASDVNGANAAWCAFSRSENVYWHSTNSAYPKWIQMQKTGTTIQGFALQQSFVHGNVTAMPKDFILQSSTNGSTWADRLAISNQTGWVTGERRAWYLDQTVTADYWRLYITSDNGYTYTVLGEFELIGALTTTPLVARSVPQAIGSNTSVAEVYAIVEDLDALTLNTDLVAYATGNNGAQWYTGTLTNLGYIGTTLRLVKATVSFPNGGYQIGWGFNTLNNKRVKIHGVYIKAK